MKLKKITIMALAATLSLSAAACGGKSESTTAAPAATTEAKKDTTEKAPKELPAPEDIDAAIQKALGEGYLAVIEVPEDEIIMTPLRDLDMTKVDAYVAKQSKVSSVDPDTVMIVKCKDAAYADEIVKSFNEAFAQAMDYARQYPYNVAKVEGTRIYKINDTVMYIVGGARAAEGASEEDAAKLAESEYEKIDEAIRIACGSLPENLAVMTEPEQKVNGDGTPVVGG